MHNVSGTLAFYVVTTSPPYVSAQHPCNVSYLRRNNVETNIDAQRPCNFRFLHRENVQKNERSASPKRMRGTESNSVLPAGRKSTRVEQEKGYYSPKLSCKTATRE